METVSLVVRVWLQGEDQQVRGQVVDVDSGATHYITDDLSDLTRIVAGELEALRSGDDASLPEGSDGDGEVIPLFPDGDILHRGSNHLPASIE